jgi:hypothetical protein
MGGGQSTPSPPPPPRIVEEPYPGTKGLKNLSISASSSEECLNCDISIDTRITTSSVKLTRDYGDISIFECKQYQKDLDAVRAREMSFQDFFTRLQSGSYSRPVSKSERGEFCEQVMFGDEDAAKIQSLADFDANQNKLKTIRIRKVSSGGSFSSGTKATYQLSLPITFEYTESLTRTAPAGTSLEGFPWKWVTRKQPELVSLGVNKVKASFTKMKLYHPSPVRIENVQHDAVLSLESEPRSSSARGPAVFGLQNVPLGQISEVVLIPLKASNLGTDSERFFSKIVKHVVGISTPDSLTGLFQSTDIPTGNDWNIKSLFWLAPPQANSTMSKITDEYYTWTGFGGYKLVEKSRGPGVINYGWIPDNSLQTRYFMLANPVGISTTDLSLLTRNLPSTPPDEAIHSIPDPSIPGNNKIFHKNAEEPALSGQCGGGTIERMTNPEDVVNNVFSTGSTDFLTEGTDGKSCDPFQNNINEAKSLGFTPMQAAQAFFNFMILIGLVIGTWLAMFFVLKDYDYKYRDFSKDAGVVVGTFMKRASTNVSDTGFAAQQALNLGSLMKLRT